MKITLNKSILTKEQNEMVKGIAGGLSALRKILDTYKKNNIKLTLEKQPEDAKLVLSLIEFLSDDIMDSYNMGLIDTIMLSKIMKEFTIIKKDCNGKENK